MAEIAIGADFHAALDQYLKGLAQVTEEAGQRATEYLYDQTVTRAREDDEWSAVADHIEVWSQDGRLTVGVRDQEFVSEAWALEYGDEVRTPNSLFRTMQPTAEGMSKVMQDTYDRAAGGMD